MTPHGMLLALAEEIELHHLAGPADALVKKVCCDHREVEAGSCFVAVPGSAHDGHAFLAQAAARGASALILQRGRESEIPADTHAACFSVDDPRAALGSLARSYHAKPDLDLAMVAVTGTNGKTTVTHLVRQILESTGRRCGLLGTIRYETGRRSLSAPLTTPNPCEFHRLLEEMRSEGLDACCFEASSHALDQGRMGPIEVDVAAFTNLSRDHLDYHPDLESYLAAKRKLLDHLHTEPRTKRRGRAVVFTDDPNFAGAEWPQGSLMVGRGEGADLRLLEQRSDRDGTRMRTEFQGVEHEFSSRLLGAFNVDNALVALGCGLALGLGIEELQRGLAAADPVMGRMEPVELPGAPLILIDYAHTPDGLTAALGACRELTVGRVHIVFGCGGDRDRGKRPLMAQAAAAGADEVYLTLDNPRTEDPARIFTDAEAGMREAYAEGRARTIEDREEAIAAVLRAAAPEDLVLIAGKGHENYQVLGTTKHPWDDREVLRAAWASRRGA